MVIRISKNYRQLAVVAVLLVGMFSGYMGNPAILRYGLVLYLLFLCFGNSYIKRNLKKISKGLTFLLCLLSVDIIINIFIYGNRGSLGSNLRSIMYGFLILLLIQLLTSLDSNGIFRSLERYLIFINVFGVTNLIVATLQIFFIHGFLMKQEWLAGNSFYEDLCCGLFGYNATHEMTYFFCFWMLLNTYEAMCATKPNRKRKFFLFIICMTIWMIILSIQNENVAFLGMYALFLAIYMVFYINEKYKISFQAMTKYLKYIILFIVFALVLFVIPASREFIEDSFFNKIEQIFMPDVSNANGSNERLAIVLYALQSGYGITGIGLGTHGWIASTSEGGFLGFNHFGLNSISSFITLGGVPFYVICVLVYSWLLCNISMEDRTLFWFVAIAIIVVASSIYTVIFTSYISVIWLALSVVVFAMTKSRLKGNL